MNSTTQTALKDRVIAARTTLDAHVREIVSWHFDPATGCPFWLDFAQKLGWDPRKEIRGLDDLAKFGPFEDEWLRGGPVRRWASELLFASAIWKRTRALACGVRRRLLTTHRCPVRREVGARSW